MKSFSVHCDNQRKTKQAKEKDDGPDNKANTTVITTIVSFMAGSAKPLPVNIEPLLPHTRIKVGRIGREGYPITAIRALMDTGAGAFIADASFMAAVILFNPITLSTYSQLKEANTYLSM